jgi:3-hydroxyisobutyrate dehydrogenase-like beta-hydroxyacid dehydrogenase
MKIAFLGLGHMGRAVASRLAGAGHELVVWNRTASAAEPLRAAGARVAMSPADASATGIVFTCLADDSAVESVVFGARGVLSGLPAGGVHVSLSTISPAMVRRLREAHEEHGQLLLSCPVIGRPDAAAAGKLVVLAAGARAALDRVRVPLDAIARNVVMLGDEPSHANVAKLCANFFTATCLEAFGEVFALAKKAGLEPARLLEVLNDVYQSPALASYGDVIVHERFLPALFSLALGLKDLRLCLAAADEEKVPLPLAHVVESNLLSGAARGMANDDWSAIARVVFENAGLGSAATTRSP